MAATPPAVAPLSQALARRRGSPLPAIILSVGMIVALAFAALGFLESRRTERLTILARDVPYGRQIHAEDLGAIELPLHRPAQLAGIADARSAVGSYAARSLGAGDLLQPAMLMAKPPGQPVYPNGEELATNMVPLPFATTTIGPLSPHDRVNVGFSDPSGTPGLCEDARSAAGGQRPAAPAARGPGQARPFACRLLSSVRVLYVDEGAGVAYLELTPYQAHTIWALQAAGLPLWGERYGAESVQLGELDRLDIGQVTRDALRAPAAPGAIPGGGSSIPGAAQP